MDEQKQPDIPGMGGETFQFTIDKDWFNPTVGYVIGIDPAYYDHERSVVSVMRREELPDEGKLVAYFTSVLHQLTLDEYGYYGTATIRESRPPLTFKQLEENMKWYGPHPLTTYRITGAIAWRRHYILEEQRRKEWLGSMVNNHRITMEARFNQYLYGKG